ncbi:glycosyltransferase family 4 protein [Paracoccus aerius]|uniref:glycosyltransferase family 4 protein n=1 Tax=Paracoccus aerius TaxID=1915382 RepID=UPI00174BED98|nr:glycosyltransferase family 4 protein [Paracoccus aerius]GHG11560.1 colanic acid biosynthesis glycosyltransferase WcaL [Paracoccus aerius]
MPSSRIAYLAGEYPAVSHTFILREVAALRAQGLDVFTCSVRCTGPAHHRGPAERAEAHATFNVLEAAKNPRRLIGAQCAALKKPGLYWKSLRKAWAMRGPGLRATIYQLFYFLEATVLAQHLKAQGATHLHNHFAQASSNVALLAARLAGIPFSFTLHGPADFTDPRLWRLDAKIADAVFVSCISHFCRSQAMLASPAEHWSRLHIVHCGVEPARYDAPPATGKGLLFVGRLAAAKGVPVLIEAMPQILAAHPDAHLTLIGDGPDRERLQDQVQRLGLSGAVRFAGYQSQDEVALALARSAAFVLPSFAEGVPVVLMEAMAARRPVVATRVAGIPELVEDGISGRVVAPGDGAALAAAVCDILSAPDKAVRMGEAGRRTVEAEFNIACEAKKLAALFQGEGNKA